MALPKVAEDGHQIRGRYLELVPHERIRHTDTFDDPNLPGEVQGDSLVEKGVVRY